MSKYIDTEKLKELIQPHYELAKTCLRLSQTSEDYAKYVREAGAYESVLRMIDSLQQKQPENIVTTANALLEALAKTPYNNKPITDAQVIVKQLLVFLKNPSSYNPNAINEQEQPEVDLEKELNRYLRGEFQQTAGGNFNNYIQIARHFYELGKSRKED